jgi:hypothetical protein
MNKKTVLNRKDDNCQKVLQLKTAMEAAIECFKGATAIVVPCTRLTSVKKCNHWLLLHIDAYLSWRAICQFSANAACVGKALTMDLDSKKYKLIRALDIGRGGNCRRYPISCEVHKAEDFWSGANDKIYQICWRCQYCEQ